MREFTYLRDLLLGVKRDGNMLVSIFSFDDSKTVVSRGDVSANKGVEKLDIFGGVHVGMKFDITPSQTEYGATTTVVETTVVAGRAAIVITVFVWVCKNAEREEPVVENVPASWVSVPAEAEMEINPVTAVPEKP